MAKDYLSHYGVPGMKWGKRKGGGASKLPKRKSHSEDRVTVDELKRHPRKTLSNSEIEKINKRLQLEKQLTNLKTDNAQLTIKKGKNWVDLAIAGVGTAGAVYGLAQTPVGKAVISGIKNG
jgi:hypothetical protein